jgi:hypothetical protein
MSRLGGGGDDQIVGSPGPALAVRPMGIIGEMGSDQQHAAEAGHLLRSTWSTSSVLAGDLSPRRHQQGANPSSSVPSSVVGALG